MFVDWLNDAFRSSHIRVLRAERVYQHRDRTVVYAAYVQGIKMNCYKVRGMNWRNTSRMATYPWSNACIVATSFRNVVWLQIAGLWYNAQMTRYHEADFI